LKKQKDSAIVILASYAAYDLPSLIGHYSITKTALVALTKILGKELLDDEIRVNCVCPGLIKTKFSHSLWSHGEDKAAEGMGVKRLGVPAFDRIKLYYWLEYRSSRSPLRAIMIEMRHTAIILKHE